MSRASGTTVCGEWQTSTYETPRFDTVWWVLAANPFLILADATPTAFDQNGYPKDLFGQFKLAIRTAQIPPDGDQIFDECATNQGRIYPTPPRDHRVRPRRVGSWGSHCSWCSSAGLLWWGVGAHAHSRSPPAARHAHRLAAEHGIQQPVGVSGLDRGSAERAQQDGADHRLGDLLDRCALREIRHRSDRSLEPARHRLRA